MWSCPCGLGRTGACLTAWAGYWVSVDGLHPLLDRAAAGDIFGLAWAAMAFFGLGWLWLGVRAALSHGDPFNGESFLWSVFVIGLGVLALHNAWYVRDSVPDFHISRAFWFGWMASNAFNIWLQLRGSGHRPPLSRGQAPRMYARETYERRTEWREQVRIRRTRIVGSPDYRPPPTAVDASIPYVSAEALAKADGGTQTGMIGNDSGRIQLPRVDEPAATVERRR
jgi:hypothetical protein